MNSVYRYAGFWKRLGAGLIDLLVFAPLLALQFWADGQSRSAALAADFATPLVMTFVGLYFHARWGQSIGKMVTKVKVVRLDGGPIGWRGAFQRQAVDLVLMTLLSTGQLVALLAVSDAAYAAGMAQGFVSPERVELGATLLSLNPIPAWVDVVFFAWVSSELVVLLFNKRKRALHDLIAGTIVVVTTPSPPPLP